MFYIKNLIMRYKPILLLFKPDVETWIFIYVLSMIFLIRQHINLFIKDHFDEQMSWCYDFLKDNAAANMLTMLIVIACGVYYANRILKRKYNCWLLLLCLFAFFYLSTSNEWRWVSTLLYIDYKWLLVLILFLFIISCILNLTKEVMSTSRNMAEYEHDTGFSITTEQKDMLDTGWKPYAENLVAKLLNTNISHESFAVGVSGEWGSGKTSFLKAIKEQIRKNVYLIDFNPWNNDSAIQVTNDFFKTLISGLTTSSFQRRIIKQYAKLLTQLDTFKTHANVVVSLFEETDESLSAMKAKAANVVASMPLPVVVVIDDLDRLEGSELMMVLKLVRVTANFKNLIFVVAYDKEYVNQILERTGIINGDAYLKKIFPLELCLPAFESYIMVNLLYKELQKGLNDDDLMKQLVFPIYRGAANHKISYYLSTFRDVKRFANQFCLNVNAFIRDGQLSEIYICDFFYLELLHYYDFKAYQHLQINTLDLLQYEKDTAKGWVYRYNHPGSIKGIESIEEKDSQRRDLLKSFKDGTGDLLWVMFGSIQKDRDDYIRYPKNFGKYFSYRVNNDMISLADFEQFLNTDSTEELSMKITDYCRDVIPKRVSLMHHLISKDLEGCNEKQIFNITYTLIDLTQYSDIDVVPLFKSKFEKKSGQKSGDLAVGLIKAIETQIEKKVYGSLIQSILTELVSHDIIDQSMEDGGYTDYVSVLDWEQLMGLSVKNFIQLLGGKTIPIQKITDPQSRFHRFLTKAVSNIASEYYDHEHDAQIFKSLLADKLTEIYSEGDNNKGIEEFFANIDPRNRNDNNIYDEDQDMLESDIQHAITSVFGNYSGNKDFYSFIEKAFYRSLSVVNVKLKQLGLKEIE